MFHLGHLLRTRYVGAGRLLGAEYATGTVRARASEVERTQESVAAVLAGMFPPGSEQTWPSEDTTLGSLWMPIPYRVLPFHEDRVSECALATDAGGPGLADHPDPLMPPPSGHRRLAALRRARPRDAARLHDARVPGALPRPAGR